MAEFVGCEPALVRYFCTFLRICGYQKVEARFLELPPLTEHEPILLTL
jgi:hypothetical protein